MAKVLDPVQGLVDYVNEIKPYHTKIVEVLVEYVHTDCIDATITENLDFCVNLGIPNINTKFEFTIIDLDQIGQTFTLSGDARTSITVGQTIQVVFSTTNDGAYIVNSVSYDYTTNETVIGVTSTIASTIVDGSVVDHILEYCPGSGLEGLHTSKSIGLFCSGGFGDLYGGNAFPVLSFTSNTIDIEGNHVDLFNNITSILFTVSDDTDIVNTLSFSIVGVTFDGLNTTTIEIVQPNTVTLLAGQVASIFLNTNGFDALDVCPVVPEGHISVAFDETLDISTEASYTDEIFAQNFENRQAHEFGEDFDILGFSLEAHTYFHYGPNLTVDVLDNTFILEGGNYVFRFANRNREIEAYNNVGLIGIWNPTSFAVVGLDASGAVGTHTITVLGNQTTYFTTGRKFYVDNPSSNSGWFTVVSSTVVGIDTVVTVQENIVDQSVFGQTDPRGIGHIVGAFYDPSAPNPTTIVVPTTPVDPTTETITYRWFGPYEINVGLSSQDLIDNTTYETFGINNELLQFGDLAVPNPADLLASTTIQETLEFSWGDVDITNWFQYRILSANATTNTFEIAGNVGTDIALGQIVRVVTSGVNDGNYKVASKNFVAGQDITEIVIATSLLPSDPQNVQIALNASTGVGGFMEAADHIPMQLYFNDTIGVTVSESATGAVATTGGSLVDAWDYPFFDIQGFDEDLGVLINLYNN